MATALRRSRAHAFGGRVARSPSAFLRDVAQRAAASPRPVWAGVLVLLAVVGLLLAFHHVVRGAVQQGAMWRQAQAAQVDAARRCEALSGVAPRRECLARKDSASR